MSETAQHLIERLSNMGATEFAEGGFQKLAERAMRTSEPDDLALAYLRAFGTPEGKRVLDDLIGRTLVHAAWDPEVDNPTERAFWREGQNSIVVLIIALMKKAEKEAGHADQG